ncbi:MAG: pitrilysin family protein [Caldilinea sp.]
MTTLSGALPSPETVVQTTLPNGLTILVRANHTSPVAVLQGSLRAGAVQESPEQAGLAAFIANMLTRGSAHYDYDAFNAAVENIGASLTVSADIHSTDVGITSLAEDFEQMLALLADIVRQPTFPAEHIERLRRMKLVHIQEREQDTASVAARRFNESLFGRHHPYGRATEGYLETVAALQRHDLAAFHERYYSPQGAVLAIAGDVDAQRIIDAVSSAFGDWMPKPIDQPTVEKVRFTERRRLHAPMPGKVQSDIVIGTYGVRRNDPDFYAVRVANCILGQFGMMGRLGERVREEQGLAYYCYSASVAEQEDGLWFAAAGVNPTDIDATVDSILAEFERLGTELVGVEELADTQAYLTGIVPLMLETNEGVASTLLSMEWYELGMDYLQRYPSLIYGVTADDVQRVVARYLHPDRCVISIAGPDGKEE